MSTSLGHLPPPENDAHSASPGSSIAESLQRVLSSEQFTGAARQQRLLRHLVCKHIAGETADLKEYTLGVEVFDRGEGFDPRLDPIVRVEASRLRSRLQKYYEGPGQDDHVRISLPRGAYLPSFEARPNSDRPAIEPSSQPLGQHQSLDNPIAGTPAPTVSLPPSRSKRLPLAIYALTGTALLAAGSFILLHQHQRPTLRAPTFLHYGRLTNGEAQLSSFPTFSPDGKFLAYARRDAGKWSLYKRNLRDTKVIQITSANDSGDCYQPAWSPDGNNLVFRSDRSGAHGLFLLDLRNGATTQLTREGYFPAWSPDSHSIVYSTASFTDPGERAGTGDSSLAIVDVRSQAVTPIGNASGILNALQPTWSPNGDRIAFWGTAENGDRDIWSIPVPTNNPRPNPPIAEAVVHDAWTDWSPTWAPDGRFLYFSSDRGGSMNLWRIGIDEQTGFTTGSPEPVMTPSSYSGWMTFAPSGHRFAYVHRTALGELYKAPFHADRGLDLDHSVQLTTGERDLHEPELSPDEHAMLIRVQDPQEDLVLFNLDGSWLRRLTNDRFSDRNAHWSPDSKKIVFSSNRSGTMQLWSMHPDGSNLRQITQDGLVPFTFAPSGSLLGFPPNGKPFVLEPSGATMPDLHLPSMFRPVRWSPDCRYVVGRMNGEGFGSGSMFVYTPAKHDYWQIASTASYPSVVWLQNGNDLLFSRDDGIFLADVPAHQIRPALPQQHNNHIRSRFTLSRDNKTAYFVQSDDQEDIWMGS